MTWWITVAPVQLALAFLILQWLTDSRGSPRYGAALLTGFDRAGLLPIAGGAP